MAEPTLPRTADELLAPADAACCAGACGPMFETPLLEQLLIRIRDAIAGRPTPSPTPQARPAAGTEEMDNR